ncbi:MAG: NFACT RNA binding domain-containing protein, partial [Candidatus Parvarchaeota archaeon]|nr:NFACT RNA binding domain-containing protein [Candidatus Parvarchaeota archaeon]
EEAALKTLEKYKRDIAFMEENIGRISDLIERLRDSSTPLQDRKKEAEKEGFAFNDKYIISMSDKDIAIDITKPVRYQMDQIYSKIKAVNLQIRRKQNKVQLIKAKVEKEDRWYSKYLWFFTSNGILGILGKNNEQNISIVKRYAKAGDIVLHADIFGSPFCVLKKEKDKEIKKEDILEGAVMTASYSSAWKAGASNIDVYYVDAQQVTSSPPSGEYLTKGSFYISGKRNYLNKVELKVYLNISINGDAVKISVSPAEGSDIYFLLKPGRKRRKDAISYIKKEIAEKRGYDIPSDAIDALLPSGDVEIAGKSGNI